MIPYFYIIQHTTNGMLYAGSRYGQNANPAELLVSYMTSSKIVNDLIHEHGIHSFVINRLVIFTSPTHAYDYETRFLRKIDAANNPRFLNQHNNMLNVPGTPEFANIMLQRYGYTNAMQSPMIRKSWSDKFMAMHGVDNPSKLQHVKDKKHNTIMENFNISDSMELARNGFVKKHGVCNPGALDCIKAKVNKTVKYKYNVDNIFQLDYTKQQAKQTCNNRYGVEHYSQSDAWRTAQTARLKTKHSRAIVHEIKELQTKYNLRFGRGWTARSDAALLELYNQIKKDNL